MEPPFPLQTPFRLGPWEVVPRDGTLRAGAEVRRLEPQAMDLLVGLAGRAGEVVSRQQLLDEVWGGRIVGDDALTGAVSQVRKALGDDARSPRFVETVPKRGYRLRIAPVPIEPGSAEKPADGGRRRGGRRGRYVLAAALAGAAVLGASAVLLLPRRPPGGGSLSAASPAAEACRHGLALLDNPSVEGLEQARLDFARALEMEPRSAEAEAGLAQVYVLQAFAGAGAPAELFPRARAAARRAAELDPGLASAHAALGAVAFLGDRDFQGAEAELRRAVRLEPASVNAHHLLALLLSALGRGDEAVAEIRRAVELAPSNLFLRTSAMETLFLARRYGEVLQMGEETLALAPESPQPSFQMGWAYAFLGRDREAYASFRAGCRSLGIPEVRLERLDGIFAAEGLPGVYRSLAHSLEQAGSVGRVQWGDLVAVHSVAGDTDRAFALVEAAVERGEPGLVWMTVSPFADGLRSDPRFERLVRRLGLPSPPG